MSKIALSGDASGTGTFTIASPNSNNNRTLTLPDATGTVVVSGSAVTFGALTATSLDLGTGSASVGTGSASTPSLTFTGDTNTGIYAPGADRIGFTEGGTQVGEFDASGNFLFNSGYGSVAVAYGCRAWVNFNGTGTVAIRASGNVSSIGDNGNGDYTVNFSNAMPDTNYVMHGTGSNSGTVGAPFVYMRWNTTAPTTSASRIGTVNDAGSSTDNLYALISVFR